MKRLILVTLAVVILLGVGVATADPGPNNPDLDMITGVDCGGSDHDYELL